MPQPAEATWRRSAMARARRWRPGRPARPGRGRAARPGPARRPARRAGCAPGPAPRPAARAPASTATSSRRRAVSDSAGSGRRRPNETDVLGREALAELLPAAEVARPAGGVGQRRRDVLEGRPVAVGAAAEQPLVELEVLGVVARAARARGTRPGRSARPRSCSRSSSRERRVLVGLDQRGVPVAHAERARLARPVRLQHQLGGVLELGLRVGVGALGEEVRPLGRADHDGDPGERLEDAVHQLLVQVDVVRREPLGAWRARSASARRHSAWASARPAGRAPRAPACRSGCGPTTAACAGSPRTASIILRIGMALELELFREKRRCVMTSLWMKRG